MKMMERAFQAEQTESTKALRQERGQIFEK
jgi:hypothetical protein